MTLEEQLKHLHCLANAALMFWDLPAGASARMINVSENVTYLVEAPDRSRAVLRVHRENYQTRRAIECELAWLDALSRDGVVKTPGYRMGLNGSAIQQLSVPGLANPRYLVLFDFVEGDAPDESGNLTAGFEELGSIAAKCHLHSLQWPKPTPFERLTWDIDAVFGPAAIWGDWRNAPELTPELCKVLAQVEATIKARLSAYAKAPDRYNLIHADMRFANLLVDGSETRLIDFDDCGYGWFMYDFAAAISFIEDDPRIPDYKAAWLKGYQSVRALTQADIDEVDTLVMLRRMALLAWIGSHIEAPEPQALAPGFAATTARLGQAWMAQL